MCGRDVCVPPPQLWVDLISSIVRYPGASCFGFGRQRQPFTQSPDTLPGVGITGEEFSKWGADGGQNGIYANIGGSA